jgi:hypothetical protein
MEGVIARILAFCGRNQWRRGDDVTVAMRRFRFFSSVRLH